jgi:hypothetical protein
VPQDSQDCQCCILLHDISAFLIVVRL